jgi:hypothetical protein
MQSHDLLEVFLTLLSISMVVAIPFTVFWLWAAKKGWASVRLLALWSGILVLSIGLILWIQVRENWLLIGSLFCAVVASLMVLTWPITAPQIVKSMKLKW